MSFIINFAVAPALCEEAKAAEAEAGVGGVAGNGTKPQGRTLTYEELKHRMRKDG